MNPFVPLLTYCEHRGVSCTPLTDAPDGPHQLPSGVHVRCQVIRGRDIYVLRPAAGARLAFLSWSSLETFFTHYPHYLIAAEEGPTSPHA